MALDNTTKEAIIQSGTHLGALEEIDNAEDKFSNESYRAIVGNIELQIDPMGIGDYQGVPDHLFNGAISDIMGASKESLDELVSGNFGSVVRGISSEGNLTRVVLQTSPHSNDLEGIHKETAEIHESYRTLLAGVQQRDITAYVGLVRNEYVKHNVQRFANAMPERAFARMAQVTQGKQQELLARFKTDDGINSRKVANYVSANYEVASDEEKQAMHLTAGKSYAVDNRE